MVIHGELHSVRCSGVDPHSSTPGSSGVCGQILAGRVATVSAARLTISEGRATDLHLQPIDIIGGNSDASSVAVTAVGRLRVHAGTLPGVCAVLLESRTRDEQPRDRSPLHPAEA